MKPLSDKFKEAIISASEFVTLLTIVHPDLLDPILVVNWHKAIESKGRKFLPFPFAMVGDRGKIHITWDNLPFILPYDISIEVSAEAAKLYAPNETVQIFGLKKMTVQGNMAIGRL